MIAWMQKHNKYLVVTIWIATIAFIGAGFVGWGTYSYGSKAGSVAKVGEVSISQEKFNFTYQNYYRQIAQELGGQFDDAKAKQMNLPQIVFRRLVAQTYLLNLAHEYGLIISDSELAKAIASLPSFQNRGSFDKKIYQSFLKSRGLSAQAFESILRDDLLVEKLMKLLNKGAVPYERNITAAALSITDTIRYRVLTPDDVNISVEDSELRGYWQKHKQSYKTPRRYRLEILWTETDSIKPDDKELKAFYRRNSFEYRDANGKELSFEAAKPKVLMDYRIKAAKKSALLDYIAFKKGKKSASETVTLDIGDKRLSKELWKQISTHSKGSLLKPKAVKGRYATVKIVELIAPRIMSFEEALKSLKRDYLAEAKERALDQKAKELLKKPDSIGGKSVKLSLIKRENLAKLDAIESARFLEKLFTSNNKNGIIDLGKKRVVYTILDQSFEQGDAKLSRVFGTEADRIKKSSFEQSLLKELSTKYPVTKFMKGI